MDEGVCFSGPALMLLGGIWAVIQGAIIYLFRGWIKALELSVQEARADRDRALEGWEKTVGVGETALRRERRTR